MSSTPTPGPGRAATRVEIYDQGYTIGGENNGAYVRKLAERVDAKMRQVARETHVVDSMRVAVLAAINLADENEALQARLQQLEAQLATQTRALHRRLDAVIHAAGRSA